MNDVDLVFAGDLILDVPQPDYWLDGELSSMAGIVPPCGRIYSSTCDAANAVERARVNESILSWWWLVRIRSARAMWS